MAELCSRRTTLELRGLAQEELVTPHNSAKDGAKSSLGKKKKESDYYEEISSDEEDYLKPADSSFKKKAYKASKGSQKKKKSIRSRRARRPGTSVPLSPLRRRVQVCLRGSNAETGLKQEISYNKDITGTINKQVK